MTRLHQGYPRILSVYVDTTDPVVRAWTARVADEFALAVDLTDAGVSTDAAWRAAWRASRETAAMDAILGNVGTLFRYECYGGGPACTGRRCPRCADAVRAAHPEPSLADVLTAAAARNRR